MITSTSLSMLRNLEYYQVMSNVLSYLKEENLEELKLESFAAGFETKFKAYDDVLVVERGNVLSAGIEDADADRDNALKSLVNVVKAYELFPSGEQSEAARQLLHVIDKYGRTIYRLPYLQESGALANLLQDLELSENKDRISLLHLEDWVNTLKEATARFDALFIGRESENSVKLSGLAKEARQAVQAEFEQLTAVINVFEVVYGAEKYAPLSAKINEALTYARQQQSRRGPREKSTEEQEAG